MTVTDRIAGLNGGAAFKVPCRVATTANITLSGLQAIDGVTVSTGNRVLVRSQTDGSENGIYVAGSGDWVRSKDFNGERDVVSGSQVFVGSGTSLAQTTFAILTADDITVGVTSISFGAVQGTASSVSTEFETKALAASATIDPATQFFRTAGHTTKGDGGGATYVRVGSEPSHIGKVQSADGAWFEIVPGEDGSVPVEALGSPITETVLNGALDGSFSLVTLMKPGTYDIDGQVTVAPGVNFRCSGKDKVIFDATDSTGTYTDGAVIYKAGTTPTQIADLSVDVARGETTLTFSSAHGRSVGELILIYNPTDSSYSGFRTTYRAGEYGIVAEITSTTELILEAPLSAAYAAAAVDVYECTGYASGKMEGFTVKATGTAGSNDTVDAIRHEFCRDIEISDIHAENGGDKSISLSKCFRFKIDATAHQWGDDSGLGTYYGLSIGNSQEGDVTGEYTGFRHGITLGGGDSFAITNRFVHVHDFVCRNADENSGTASADWHGNVEDCTYVDGVCFGGGLNLAGNRNIIKNVKVNGSSSTIGIIAREPSGMDHTIDGVTVFTLENDVNRGVFLDLGGNDTDLSTDTQEGGTLKISDCCLEAPNHTRHGITIRNRGFTGDDYRVLVDNFQCIMPLSNGSSFAAVRVDTVSGDAPVAVQATNITVSDGFATPSLLLAGTGDSAALVRQDPVTATEDVAVTTSTSIVTTPASSFPRRFAKAPVVIGVQTGHQTSGDRIGLALFSADASDVRWTVFRSDTTGNFGADATVTVNYTASLWEF